MTDITEPWIPQGKIPFLRREFDMNRDPYIRLQLLDLEKTEAQRRRETAKRNSRMVENERPSLEYKPPPKMRGSVERQSFNERWLLERRDAVLEQACLNRSCSEYSHHRFRSHSR